LGVAHWKEMLVLNLTMLTAVTAMKRQEHGLICKNSFRQEVTNAINFKKDMTRGTISCKRLSVLKVKT
jgi:hypothetical protein